MTERIYLDNSATTPMDPRVTRAMMPFLESGFGNPSSLHQEGRFARQAIEDARDRVALLLNAKPQEIVYTGSGTEADNLALCGVMDADSTPGKHLITSAIEHPAILETCRILESRGVAVTYLPVSSDGLVQPDELQRALRPTTRLISIMAANNVVGTIEPLEALSHIAHRHGALFHTDAVQAAGKIPLDVDALGIDLLSLTGHKLHGPKGVGALYVREGIALEPILHGGGQEAGLRSATENVAGIVGLGTAAEIACREMEVETRRLDAIREDLQEQLEERIPDAYLIGHRKHRLPGHICLGIRGLESMSARIMFELDLLGIAISTGSACSSNHAAEPSYILRAMGFDDERAAGALRITLGRFNTRADAEHFAQTLPAVVEQLRPSILFSIHPANLEARTA